MRFYNQEGDYLEFSIKNYEFPDLEPDQYEEYDANWLEIAIKAKDSEYQWEAACPCLLTWEAKSVLDFFRAFAEGRAYDKLYFEGPELFFGAAGRDDGKCLITCGLWLDMHPYSFEDDVDPYYMNFLMTREELAEEVNSFALEISHFPRRNQ